MYLYALALSRVLDHPVDFAEKLVLISGDYKIGSLFIEIYDAKLF